MPQREIYFFGKLNQSRDFIVSDNLQTGDRHFWDNWFDRCVSQDRLIPFIRKAFVPLRVWLFCIKLSEGVAYVGLTAFSSDKTGRQYPFVLFSKLTPYSDLYEAVGFFVVQVDFFRQVLQNGKCVIGDCVSLDCAETALFEPFRNYLADKGKIGSFWLESGGSRYVEHEGLPSCSLFNKLFGS